MPIERITSAHNPRIKAVAALRDRRDRRRSGRIVIDGAREIDGALSAGVRIRELYFCEESTDSSVYAAIRDRATRQGAAVFPVAPNTFGKIAYGDRRDGVVAVGERPRRELDDLTVAPVPLVAVVERMEKPGNLGAILRSADGAGVDAVIAVDPVTDVYGPNVIRASLGTVFSVPIAEADVDAAVAWLADRKINVVAASPEVKRRYCDVDLAGPTAIVLGAEAAGLGSGWDRADVQRASVPMLGRIDSLNVSATAAIFFYEARRQRDATVKPPAWARH